MGLTKKSPFNRSELLTFSTQVAYSSKMAVSELSFLTISSLSLQILTKRLRSFISGIAEALPWWKRSSAYLWMFYQPSMFLVAFLFIAKIIIFLESIVNINTTNLNKLLFKNLFYNIFSKASIIVDKQINGIDQ